MDNNVNSLVSLIDSTGYTLASNCTFKIKGARKNLSIQEFYSKFANSIFKSISFGDFEEQVIKINDLRKESTSNSPIKTFTDLLKNCWFIYEKFRWSVTSKRIKVFYEKIGYDYTTNQYTSNEYFNLGSDKESEMFFNAVCKNPIELDSIEKMLTQYNIENSEIAGFRPLTCEDLVKYIITDLRQKTRYSIPTEPVTLTNNFEEPAYKFFDIESRLMAGRKYREENNGQYPPAWAWDEIFSRVRNQAMVPYFKAFIASIFVGTNKSKQILYLYGEGDDGKSCILNKIKDFLGKDLVFILDQHLHMNQFSTHDALGKRLCIGEELNAPNVLKHKTIHALSGDSPLRVEPKGEKAFHINPQVSIIIASNEMPKIEDVRNQVTRLIYVGLNSVDEVKKHTEGAAWEKGIDEGFEAMLYEGLELYFKLSPQGRGFILPSEYSEDLETLFEEETTLVRDFIDSCLIPSPQTWVKCKLKEALIAFVSLKLEISTKDVSQLPEYKKFTEIRLYERLKKKIPNLTRQKIYLEGTQERGYIGVTLTSSTGILNDIFLPQTML